MKEQILAILETELPKFWKEVNQYKGFLGGNFLAIKAAADNYLINGVSGQRAQSVSLSLDLDTLELQVQIYGGNGGNRIYREPNRNDDKEKYLAMKGVKVPFRTPQKNEAAVLRAITKFFKTYKETLQSNIDVLCYRDRINYAELLK